MVDAWRSEVDSIWPSLRHDREMQHKVLAARLLWVWLATVWMLPADSADTTGSVDSADPAAAPLESPAADPLAHDLALYTSDPRRIVSRWADLAASARGADAPIAEFAAEMGRVLQRTWLA